jgi:EAL domain-containing protein (putative c-di-GMP-specific phosphodiesterase class I)
VDVNLKKKIMDENKPKNFQSLACLQFRNADLSDFDFTMAFQPIVDFENTCVYGYEALVCGLPSLIYVLI